MIHPTHNPIRFKSTAMAEEAQICTRCGSVVPEVLALPCARPAEDQAVEMVGEDIRQALEIAAKVRRLEELAQRLEVDDELILRAGKKGGDWFATVGNDPNILPLAGDDPLGALLAALEAAAEGGDGE